MFRIRNTGLTIRIRPAQIVPGLGHNTSRNTVVYKLKLVNNLLVGKRLQNRMISTKGYKSGFMLILVLCFLIFKLKLYYYR
jgi:hypothetical protein